MAIKQYKMQRQHIFSIGNVSLGKAASTFGRQENALKNGSLEQVEILERHHEGIKALMEHLLSLPNERGNIGGRDKENLGTQAADAQNDAVLVDPLDESENVVSQLGAKQRPPGQGK